MKFYFIAIQILFSFQAFAAELQKSKFECGVGPVVYLGSDDNARFGLSVQSNIFTFIAVRYVAQGTKFGSTKQERYLYSLGGLLPVGIFGASNLFYAPLGLSYQREKTILNSEVYTNKNLGLFAGLGMEFFQKSPFFLNAEWIVHVFGSGISTVYFSTAKRQTLSVGVGWRLL